MNFNYTCHKLRNTPDIVCLTKKKFKNKNGKFHAHATEENESNEERIGENEDSNEEYVLISSLIGSISYGSDTWVIDSGASKHIIGHRYSLSCLTQKYYQHKV